MKNAEKCESKRSFLVSILIIILLVGLVIGTTYALFVYIGVGKQKNTIHTGTLTFSYTELSDGISLTNAMPVSDEVGKKMKSTDKDHSYFDFSISSKLSGARSIQYEVYATEVDVENKVDPDYVKIYLTDSLLEKPVTGYEKEVPVYSKLKNSSITKNAKTLYTGTFNSTGSQSFRLRMWLADSYNVSSSSKSFKIKVNVLATE